MCNCPLGMSNLLEAKIITKECDSPSFKSHLLPIAPQLMIGPQAIFPVHVANLTGFILCGSYVTTVARCWYMQRSSHIEKSAFCISSYQPLSIIFSNFRCEVFWSLDGGRLIRMDYPQLNLQGFSLHFDQNEWVVNQDPLQKDVPLTKARSSTDL